MLYRSPQQHFKSLALIAPEIGVFIHTDIRMERGTGRWTTHGIHLYTVWPLPRLLLPITTMLTKTLCPAFRFSMGAEYKNLYRNNEIYIYISKYIHVFIYKCFPMCNCYSVCRLWILQLICSNFSKNNNFLNFCHIWGIEIGSYIYLYMGNYCNCKLKIQMKIDAAANQFA